MVAISSCLSGVKCRYNGKDSYNEEIIKDNIDNYIAICPEMLAGFGIPRAACEIIGGSGENVLEGKARIVDENGVDITLAMISGAKKALEICKNKGVVKAYLQSKSPTCGCGKIYDGSFSHSLKVGNGIFTALLIQNDIEVVEV